MKIQYHKFPLRLRLPVHQGSLPQLREAKHRGLADLLHISAYSSSRSLVRVIASATDALPGVSKIRYVVASLLDELDTHASHSLEMPAAQNYLGRPRNHDAAEITHVYSNAIHQLF